VLNAEKNVKSRSNLTEADQYIAKNAIQNEDQQEDTNLASSIHPLFTIFRFFHFQYLLLPLTIIGRNVLLCID
jgi:hypothetical protein